jgi:diguanylate cyclase (GGDEF)-like protein/PAS domain S-box-containing protein
MTVVPGRIRKNLTGVIVEVDDLVLDVLGFGRDEMIGRRSTDFLHPEDHEQAFASWVRMLNDSRVPHTIQVRHCDAGGRWLWVEAVNTVDAPDADSVTTELTFIDRPPHDRTMVSNQLLRRLAEALPFGIAQIDTEHRVVFSNGKLDEVTGQADGDLLAKRLGHVLPSDRPVLDEAVRKVLDGHDLEIEFSIAHPRRGVRRCSVILSALAVRSGSGTSGALLCITDITDQVRERAEIIQLAKYDSLTKCLNRPAILDALTTAVGTCAGVAVIFLDLDGFKAVNDTHGHAAGDRLLVAVGQRLRQSTRQASVGRLGGDLLLVVARDVPSAEQATLLGRRLARAIGRPLHLGGALTRPAASVGVAWSADPAADPSALVARADEAMYAAKRRRSDARVRV